MSETAAPLGRRERKKRETRAAIHRAALTLFVAKGYSATRVSDIAEAADVSEATFFRYFSSKEEVALVALMSRIDAVLDALAARPEGELPLEACLGVMDTPDGLGLVPGQEEILTIQLLMQSPSLTGHFFWKVTQITDRLAAEFARRLGVADSSIEAQLLATAVIAVLNAVLRAWIADPSGSNPFEATRSAFLALAHGLEPTTGSA